MIPLPGFLMPGPRLYAELGMLVLVLVLAGTTVTYRALYKAEHTRVAEQLSNIAAETAKGTTEAWQRAYNDLLAQSERDKAAAEAAAQSAVARARRAESAMDTLRRRRNEEAATNPCVGQPLSPATVDRLRQLEDGYRPGS